VGQTVEATMTIGDLAQRAGVPVATIRTWEQRYGLPAPARRAGGHRRYGEDHLRRIIAMRLLIEQGSTVAAAARRVATDSPEPLPPSLAAFSAALDPGALEAAYRATRVLLRARDGGPAVDALVGLVRELGGDVVPADEAPPHALPLDLSLGERAPLLAVAEPYTLARLQLERVLPTVVEDARHAVLVARRLESLGKGPPEGRR
jgi:DNA-binding transcriptional MerR regulator